MVFLKQEEQTVYTISHNKRLPVSLTSLLVLPLVLSSLASTDPVPTLSDVEHVFAEQTIRGTDSSLQILLNRISDCRDVMPQRQVAILEERIVERAFGLRAQTKDGGLGELELVLWKAANLKCCTTNTFAVMAIANYLGNVRPVEESTCKAEFEEARKLDAQCSLETDSNCVRSPIERSIPSSPRLRACYLKWRDIRNRNMQIRKHRKFVCSSIEPAVRELLSQLSDRERQTFVSEFTKRAHLSMSEKTILGM